MDSKSVIFFTCLFFLSIETATCFNITKMLSQYSDFSNLNDQLTQTQIAADINSRQTITILAVNNAAMSAISGSPADTVKKILSLHVILDYFDVQKLQKLDNNTAILTTLFQSTGLASGQQGFLNVTDTSSGSVAFRSAVPGSSESASLVKSVVSQPYNISVLQISSLVIPTGIGGNTNSSSPKSPATAPTKAPASTPAKSPAKSPSSAPSPKSGRAPAPSGGSPSPKSSKAPAAGPSNDANAPSTGDSPAGGPSADTPVADGPVADSPIADGPVAGSPIADGPMADSPAGTADTPVSDDHASGVGAGNGVHGLALLLMIISSASSLSFMV